MTEKTIWPEWINDRLPIEEDVGRKFDGWNGMVYAKWMNNSVITITPFKEINPGAWWARITDENKTKTWSTEAIAMPEECEARKKEQNEVKTVGVGDTVSITVTDGRPELIVNGKPYEGHPWIPGNEPEKEGWYFKTTDDGTVKTDFYEKIHKWRKGEYSHIIAHKRITLPAPYVPERELLCPFCNSNDFAMTTKNDFICNDCFSEIREKTKERIFEIYDLLNK